LGFNYINWYFVQRYCIPFLPDYGDTPEDIEAIKKGIDIWNEGEVCIDG